MKAVVLDSTPLGQITHPKSDPQVKLWLNSLNQPDINLFIPEIIDYELRRQLLLDNRKKSLERLDALIKNRLIALDRNCLLMACELWAWIRKQGLPTADKLSLDGDVILVAQSLSLKKNYNEIIIVTENIKHISRFSSHGLVVVEWSETLSRGYL
jgi:toxin FitB